MFFLVGVIYDRAHHRNLDNFRGLMEPMPFYGGVSVIFFAAPGPAGVVDSWRIRGSSPLGILTDLCRAGGRHRRDYRGLHPLDPAGVYFGTNPPKDYQDADLALKSLHRAGGAGDRASSPKSC